MNSYNKNRILYLLTIIVYLVMRLGIGDLMLFFNIDFLLILLINITSTIMMYYTNINKNYILLYQSISFLITPILNYKYGPWKRPSII